MIGLSLELTGCIIAFQVLQALVAGVMIALLLWYEKKLRTHRVPARGDPA